MHALKPIIKGSWNSKEVLSEKLTVNPALSPKQNDEFNQTVDNLNAMELYSPRSHLKHCLIQTLNIFLFFDDKIYLQSYTGIISSRFSSCVMARPTRELALSSRASRSSSAGG